MARQPVRHRGQAHRLRQGGRGPLPRPDPGDAGVRGRRRRRAGLSPGGLRGSTLDPRERDGRRPAAARLRRDRRGPEEGGRLHLRRDQPRVARRDAPDADGFVNAPGTHKQSGAQHTTMGNETGLLTAYAEDLVPGARNAIRTCLRVAAGERVVIVTDRETEEIAASLADQVRHADGRSETYLMEDYGPRPMLALPPPIAAALERADVSIYAGQPKEAELASRRALTGIVDRRQIRHAHTVSISHRIMTEAMRA